MAGLPEPADIARVLPAALAEAGGSIEISSLEESLSRGSRTKIRGVVSDEQAEYLRGSFEQAMEIIVRSRSAEKIGNRLTLTDKGWAQARALGVHATAEPSHSPQFDRQVEAAVTIDLSHAEPWIRYESRDGELVLGYLRENAQEYHGRMFAPPASALLDALYRAEIDGVRVSEGFYRAMKDVGAVASATQILLTKCRVGLPGLERETRSGRGSALGQSARRGHGGRRAGITWERLVCEVIGELGGHADWPTIAEAVSHHRLAEEDRSWREETRQALRNHTTPKGRSYFDVVELDETVVYTLTQQGQRLAAKRSEDERAPTLSKLFAKAIAPDDTSLTDYELYALLHLAAELGKPNEARAIYHRLPEDFPDEDRYYMAVHLLDRADEVQKDAD